MNNVNGLKEIVGIDVNSQNNWDKRKVSSVLREHWSNKNDKLRFELRTEVHWKRKNQSVFN